MAVFSAIAAAVVKAVAGLTLKAFFVATAKFIGTVIVSNMVGRMLAKRAGQGSGGMDGGGRVQLPPATDNKIPVVYGNAFLGGPVIDAYLTTDQKTMYYIIALAEKTTYGNITFDTGNIFYDGKICTFGSDGAGGTTKVTQLITNSTPAQIDTKINGYLNIYLYNNGSANGFNTPTPAYNVFPKWSGDANYAMSNTAFAIIKVTYNTDAGTTSLGGLTAKVMNTGNTETANTGRYLPGSAIYDYMVNDRYGCGIPASKIDGNSLLIDLDQYANANITYVNTSNANATQSRYLVNGPLDTSASCLENLQILVDSADSWLQYSEKTGKWRVVINKAYTGNTSSLFLVDSTNLVGGIQINPIDLNDTYNEVEVAYPNKNIKDQTDYQVIQLQDTPAVAIMSPNEAINRLNLTLPVVNEAVQAKYLGVRRLLQSREDITISFQTDFSGIQIEAGDVIRVKHEQYGWDVLNGGLGKLFRVMTVAEQTFEDNTVGAQIVAFEYNGTIYDDNAIQDFVPAYNTGLVDPNVFDIPVTPTIANGVDANSGTTYFSITGTTPANGVTTYFDFNYGTSTNVAQHILYRTAQNGVGEAFPASSNVTITINDLAQGNYYFSVTARNDYGGRQSNSTASVLAWPGPQITAYNPNTGTGGITANNIQPNTINAAMFVTGLEPVEIVNTLSGCNVATTGRTVFYTVDNKLYTCNGTTFIPVAAANQITGNITANQITNVYANTVFGNFTFANIPNANIIGNIIDSQIQNVYANVVFGNLSNANIPNANIIGQLVANQIANVSNTAILGEIISGQLANSAVTSDKLAANSVIAGKIAALAVTAGTINTGAVTAGTIAANAVTANEILANSITSAKIAANAVVAGKIDANAVTAGSIAANAVVAGTIAANAVLAGTIAANAVLAGAIAANAVVANNIAANAIIAGKIDANAVTAGTIAANAVVAGTVAANAIGADQITAGAVTAAKISVTTLGAINANLGNVLAGNIYTATSGNRVEISNVGNYPIWYGSGSKTEANARFYLDTGGNAFFAGTLGAAGGTINFDTQAVSNSGAFGYLKGAQFVLCRDGDTVTFPVAYPSGTGPRVSVIFVGGGLTYSNDPNLNPPLYQNFQALNVTETSFDASLKLSEAFGSNSLTTTTDSFGGGTSVNKTLSNEAYDNIYTADFSANIYCDYFLDLSEFGGGSLYYGYIDVSLDCNTGSGNTTISPSPIGVYAFRDVSLGPGYEVVSGYSIYGTVTGAGAGSDFYLVASNTGYGSGTVSGGNLTYTYSSATANTISATPTGVPSVVALVYLQ